ncbi:hypothetical protein E4U22_001874 [Claviceps purpurea]|uniref:Related to dnaJ-like proteins n=1 Tax=Claviceps purpurea (strain 20.1) TaxID=1111077 RepID=M1W5M6_CLAP2|nr:hypothetical protein E4U26_008432 [Claviceps purpurea]KAG6312317.1 hypothetical protein E4U22_001874 [Claviceps purpurea]CCE34186.1 related to dnaJ-like proteins [Claviceps purpurea 20.1]
MGAQQSATDNIDDAAAEKRTCYYEVIGVEWDATDLEIRKAYRRKALELHPDRNLDDVHESTKKFTEIQAAYEILSDPQERAWYDSHRGSILTGNEVDNTEPTSFRNIRLTSTEEILNLIRKFSHAKDFNDESTGFFGMAREVFEHLVIEEEAAVEVADAGCLQYPTFGFSCDEYDTVIEPYQQPDWTLAPEDDEQGDDFSDIEEEFEVEILKCDVCNKLFKSIKQLQKDAPPDEAVVNMLPLLDLVYSSEEERKEKTSMIITARLKQQPKEDGIEAEAATKVRTPYVYLKLYSILTIPSWYEIMCQEVLVEGQVSLTSSGKSMTQLHLPL